jgi:hypothetical protein
MQHACAMCGTSIPPQSRRHSACLARWISTCPNCGHSAALQSDQDRAAIAHAMSIPRVIIRLACFLCLFFACGITTGAFGAFSYEDAVFRYQYPVLELPDAYFLECGMMLAFASIAGGIGMSLLSPHLSYVARVVRLLPLALLAYAAVFVMSGINSPPFGGGANFPFSLLLGGLLATALGMSLGCLLMTDRIWNGPWIRRRRIQSRRASSG